jgi:hypothetical protein
MELKQLLKQIKARAQELDDPEYGKKLDEVRGYLILSPLLPITINFEEPKTIRKAQRALATIEARLDRIITLHHDAKRVLQIISMVEHQLLSYMARYKILPEKTTGPAQQQKLTEYAPLLVKMRIQWAAVDSICTQAQQRLASAKDSLKLQAKLDDNLRWAQERSPG